MKHTLAALASLLLSAAILLAGNGLQGTLLAVRGNFEGFSLTEIGLLMSGYHGGLILGCYVTPVLVGRVGHIRVFAALASLGSAIALAHLLAIEPAAWILLRVSSGVCFAGLHMVIESWINERAQNHNRGRVLAVYRVVDFSALTAGQLLLLVADPLGFTLFCLVSILVSLALVPVALTTSVAPQPIHSTHLPLREIFTAAPISVFACLTVGLTNGSFWAVGPAFVQRLGYGLGEIALFMSLVIVGGALAQLPLGIWSDRVDRRKLVITVACFAAGAGLALFLLAAQFRWALMAGGLLFGIFSLPLYALAIAHANDCAPADRFVQFSGGLLLLYGVGAAVGPLAAGAVMQLIAASTLFAFTALMHCLLVLVALRTLRRQADFRMEQQEHFIPVPRTVPTVFELDPRNVAAEGAE